MYQLTEYYNCNCEICVPEVVELGTFGSWELATDKARRESAHGEPLAWINEDVNLWRAESGYVSTEYRIKVIRTEVDNGPTPNP